MDTRNGLVVPEAARLILDRLHAAGYAAYTVGGCVRDALSGRAPHDWDICTSAPPEATMAVFSDRRTLDVGMKHGTVTVLMDDAPYEITTFRMDGDYSDGRHPDSVAFTGRVEDDLARRDFTVNAMAYAPGEGLVDPFGGRDDLERGVIRCVGEPRERFREDALRILRGMRFAARFGFAVEAETARAMRELAPLLRGISAERVRAELEGLLVGPDAARVLREFTDVLCVPIPEIAPCVGFDQLNPCHPYDVWEHTIHAVENIEPTPLLRWTMLFHDLGKPPVFSPEGAGKLGHFLGHGKKSAELAAGIMDRLRFSNAEKADIRELVERHDRFIRPEKPAVRRELGRIGPELFRLSMLVSEADVLAQSPAYAPPRLAELARLQALADEITAAGECVDMRGLAVSGGDLISLGYTPGPALGAALQRLLELVLDDPSKNDRETLLELAAAELSKNAGNR